MFLLWRILAVGQVQILGDAIPPKPPRVYREGTAHTQTEFKDIS